jgi:hypothetical protein
MSNSIKEKWIEFCRGNTLLAKKEDWEEFKKNNDNQLLTDEGMANDDYRFNMASVSWTLEMPECDESNRIVNGDNHIQYIIKYNFNSNEDVKLESQFYTDFDYLKQYLTDYCMFHYDFFYNEVMQFKILPIIKHKNVTIDLYNSYPYSPDSKPKQSIEIDLIDILEPCFVSRAKYHFKAHFIREQRPPNLKECNVIIQIIDLNRIVGIVDPELSISEKNAAIVKLLAIEENVITNRKIVRDVLEKFPQIPDFSDLFHQDEDGKCLIEVGIDPIEFADALESQLNDIGQRYNYLYLKDACGEISNGKCGPLFTFYNHSAHGETVVDDFSEDWLVKAICSAIDEMSEEYVSPFEYYIEFIEYWAEVIAGHFYEGIAQDPYYR